LYTDSAAAVRRRCSADALSESPGERDWAGVAAETSYLFNPELCIIQERASLLDSEPLKGGAERRMHLLVEKVLETGAAQA
jgi:hypothetical protein